jgi:hypothetical protein
LDAADDDPGVVSVISWSCKLHFAHCQPAHSKQAISAVTNEFNLLSNIFRPQLLLAACYVHHNEGNRARCMISGSQGSEYEDGSFLGYSTVSLVETDRRLRDAYRLHHQGEDGGSTHL